MEFIGEIEDLIKRPSQPVKSSPMLLERDPKLILPEFLKKLEHLRLIFGESVSRLREKVAIQGFVSFRLI